MRFCSTKMHLSLVYTGTFYISTFKLNVIFILSMRNHFISCLKNIFIILYVVCTYYMNMFIHIYIVYLYYVKLFINYLSFNCNSLYWLISKCLNFTRQEKKQTKNIALLTN